MVKRSSCRGELAASPPSTFRSSWLHSVSRSRSNGTTEVRWRAPGRAKARSSSTIRARRRNRRSGRGRTPRIRRETDDARVFEVDLDAGRQRRGPGGDWLTSATRWVFWPLEAPSMLTSSVRLACRARGERASTRGRAWARLRRAAAAAVVLLAAALPAAAHAEGVDQTCEL